MKKFPITAATVLAVATSVSAQDAVSPSASPSPSPMAEHARVIVSTTPLGGDLFEQTQSITVLTGEELQLRLEPTIGETLNREAGISSTGFAPGASRPVIRGLGEDRIRVLDRKSTRLNSS